jgi:pyruvate,water dikinase
MVRSDKSSSGVAFTIDPDTGFQNTIINGSWGLENIVQGTITPDEWMVFKPTLENKTKSHSEKDIAVEKNSR